MKIVIRKPEIDGIGNVLKGFISAYSVYENTVVECNPTYVFGNYDTVLEAKHIFVPDNEGIDYFRTCRLLVLASEECDQPHIPNEYWHTDRGSSIISPVFSDHVLIDWNYDADKLCEKVRTRILTTIDRISFHPDVIAAYEKMKTAIFTNGPALGISVRTWRCHHEHDIDRPYSGDVYKNKIRDTILADVSLQTIVLSTDNESVNQEYIDYCKSVRPGLTVHMLSDKGTLNELQYTLLKIWLLSDCSVFICNRISTFSELVFWFGKCQQTIFPLF
jgi:hypothetical protein